MVTRGKTGTVRVTGSDMEELRRACFDRDGGRCVVCGVALLWERGEWLSMHMAHVRGRGAGGSDVLENVVSKCPGHHWEEHNPKVVPKKERA